MQQLELTKRSEEACKALGVRTDYFSDNDKTYQLLYFDSPIDLVEKAIKGWDSGLYSKNNTHFETINLMTNRTRNHKVYFGPEYTNCQQTYEAITEQKVSKAVLENIDSIREKYLNIEEVRVMLETARTFKRKRVFSDEGAELSIDRLMSGNEDYWERTTKGRKSNIYKLFVNIGNVGAAMPSDFHKVAAFIIVVAEMIDKAGFSLQIVQGRIKSYLSRITKSGTIVNIKDAGEAINVNKLMALGVQGYIRAFNWSHEANLLCYQGSDSYGSSASLDKALQQHLEYDNVIDFHNATSEHASIECLQNIFNDLKERI